MDQTALRQIKDILSKNDTIAVAVGKDPNLDSMGAALALYLGLLGMGKNVSVATATEPLVEVSSLVGIDKVQTHLEAEGADLVVSFPYREKEIEKVSYTLEDGYLNIIVKAGEKGLGFVDKDVRYKRSGGGAPSMLFVVGTPRLSDLGSLFDPQALKNTTVINIDNSKDNQGFGDVVLVSTKSSSVSEQVASLLQSLQIELDSDISQNLLSGITFATNNFQKPSASYTAFEIAAFLMRHGAVRQRAGVRREPAQLDESAFFPQLDNKRPLPQERPFPQFPTQRPGRFPRAASGVGTSSQSNQSLSSPFSKTLPKQEENQDPDEAPSDWLSPKIYKGSTNI